eukprot:TRINITY_DN2982_c3_g1_i1.p1 TRINITY_DN2982_c3_g1~~TRINITY_DN2982_c3_g1_i1.p1  ORF type:complete len:292 (-),score=132.50 TRINITY_DN2982_c3_g1_i1:209-1084(-)
MSLRSLFFGFLIFIIFFSLIKSDDYYYDEEDGFYAPYVRGIWRDNFNQTVYVCASKNSKIAYISWARAGAPRNITSWAFGEIKDEEMIEGEFHTLSSNNLTGPVIDGDFRIYKFATRWIGEINNKVWYWENQTQISVPPSVCFYPSETNLPSRLIGRWQRVTATADLLVIDICHDGKGWYQYTFAGNGGLLDGDLFADGQLWIGKRYNYLNHNLSYYDEIEANVNATVGGHSFVQSGASVLTEIWTDERGAFRGRSDFQYISSPENCYFGSAILLQSSIYLCLLLITLILF